MKTKKNNSIMLRFSRGTATMFGVCLCFCLWMLVAGCKITFEPLPKQRKEIAPIVEQRVQEYNDSTRVLSVAGGKKDEEDIYVIAVKNGAAKAKALILKK